MRASIWGLFLAGALSSAIVYSAEAPKTAPVESIVSPKSYWRYFYTFGPPRYLSHDGKLVATQTRYSSLNGGESGNQLTTDKPPEKWAQAEFDDSRWCVQRAPLPFQPEVDTDGSGPYTLDCVRCVCARTRFLVKDPAAVKKLTLNIKYYGGLIVYLNGHEIVRGNIPTSSPLADEGYAEPYPAAAYTPVTPEQKAWGMIVNSGFWSPTMYWVPWYSGVKPEQKKAHDEFTEAIGNIRRRKVSVDLDPKFLKAGVNVLALENRCSPIAEITWGKKNESFTVPPSAGGYSPKMAHIGINAIDVVSDPIDVAGAPTRPDGVQAWVEDVHRWMLEEDYLEPGVQEPRLITLVGVPGGACSGEAVIGTTKDLPNPTATLSSLTGPSGAKLPAEAASVRWGKTISVEQIKRNNPGPFRTYMQDIFLFRYRAADTNIHFSGGREDAWSKDTMRLYDQLSPDAPAKIAAGTSQPVWVTLEIPRDAKPGLYSSELQVKAAGLNDVIFPVRLQVIGAPLSEPAEYKGYVGVDESPWALAKGANVKLWSDEHWKLIEKAMQLAGKLGARVVGIPFIQNTELNNDTDTMIKLIKKPDGGYDFDFAVADRYIDLWRRYGHVQSDIIVYLILPYGEGVDGTGTLTLIDPATKQESPFKPPAVTTPEGQKFWLDCAKAIHTHYSAKGVKDESLHWGLFSDWLTDSGFTLGSEMAKEIPGVGWARSSHEGRKIGRSETTNNQGKAMQVTWNSAVRHFWSTPFVLPRIKGGPSYAYDATGYQVKGCEGIKNPDKTLLLPRADSDVSALGVYSPLYQLRSTQEMALTGKYRGIARICIDGWGRGGYFGPFTPYLLYPGKQGTLDGSAQFEALRAGLQEAEIRIGLESSGDLSPAVKSILDRRTELAWMLTPRPEGLRIGEYYSGWQERSWALFAAAAAATGKSMPSADEKTTFFAIPAK